MSSDFITFADIFNTTIAISQDLSDILSRTPPILLLTDNKSFSKSYQNAPAHPNKDYVEHNTCALRIFVHSFSLPNQQSLAIMAASRSQRQKQCIHHTRCNATHPSSTQHQIATVLFSIRFNIEFILRPLDPPVI